MVASGVGGSLGDTGVRRARHPRRRLRAVVAAELELERQVAGVEVLVLSSSMGGGAAAGRRRARGLALVDASRLGRGGDWR